MNVSRAGILIIKNDFMENVFLRFQNDYFAQDILFGTVRKSENSYFIIRLSVPHKVLSAHYGYHSVIIG